MSDKAIPVEGRVDGVTESDAARLSVVALRGNTLVSTSRLRPDGSYLLNLPSAAAREPSAFQLQLAVLPGTASAHPDRVPAAPRVGLTAEALEGKQPVRAPRLAVSAELLDKWSVFWPEWCVSGTVVGPNGCPAPAA